MAMTCDLEFELIQTQLRLCCAGPIPITELPFHKTPQIILSAQALRNLTCHARHYQISIKACNLDLGAHIHLGRVRYEAARGLQRPFRATATG